MGTLGTLAVSIVGDQQQFEKSMGRMKTRTQEVGKSMQDMGKRVSKTGGTLTKWVSGPIAAAGGAVGGMILKTSQWADELLDLEQQTGLSTDSIQEWREVATRAGTDQDAVANATQRLRRQYNDLEQDTGKAAEGFSQLGMDVKDSEGNMKDMETLVDEAIPKLADMDDVTRRNAIANDLFGGKVDDILPILAESGDELEKMREEANVVDEEDLQALDEFREMWDRLKKQFMDTFREVATNLLPLFQETLMPLIQEELMPAIERFGEFIGRLIDWFMELDPTVQKTVAAVIGLAAALGPILLIVGKIITVLGGLVAGIAAINPVTVVIVGVIAGLIAILQDLWRNNEEFKEAVIEIWGNIRDFLEETWDSLKEVFEVAVELIREIVEQTMNELEDFWDNWGETILSIAERVWDQVKLVIETAINLIEDTLGLVLAVIQGDWEEAWERIKSIGENIWNLISGTIENVFGGIRDFLTRTWDTIRDNTIGRVKRIYNVVTGWFGRLQNRISSIWTGIQDGIRGTVNRIITVIERMVNWSIRNINRFIRGVNRAIDTINSIPGVNIGSVPTMDQVNIPRLHSGTQYFRPPGGQREGLALLERGEQVTAQGDKTTGGEGVNFARMFEGANFYVRSDQDIKEVAKELHRHMKSTARGQGVQI